MDLFNYDSEDEIIEIDIEKLVAPDCRSQVLSFSNDRFQGKDAPAFYETKGLKKNGTIFDIEIKASTYINNGIIHTLVIIRDITEIKQVEKKLKINNRTFTMITKCHQILLRTYNEQDFLNNICRMIIETGEYEYVWISYRQDKTKTLFSVANYSNREINDNIECMSIASKCIWDESIIVHNNILTSSLDEIDKEILLGAGFKSLICLPLLVENNAIGSIAIYSMSPDTFLEDKVNLNNLAEDISYGLNSIRLKEKQKNLENQLLQAQKMETIGTLAGGIAHDFNNIMTPILGYAELTLSHMSAEDPLYKYNEQILSGAIRAKELVKQILTFSHKENFKKEPVIISKIVKEALQLMGSLIPKTIVIHKHISKSCGKVMADPAQLHQIIANLCTNSFHAMENDGGELTIELKKTVMNTEMKERYPDLTLKNYAQLLISDTGTGMDNETKNRIFEPFFTTKPVNKGTGLGLSVVHGIIKNHNGSIFVQSNKGLGTTFNIFLPMLHQDEEAEYLVQKEKESEKKVILLLDDQHDITELLKLILKSSGYEVESYNTSDEALKGFNSNPQHYSLILTDFIMPHMNGMEFIKAVHRKRKNIPAIMITGHDDHLSEREKQAYNIKQVIYKPILKNNLLEAVAENIKKEIL